MVDVHAAVVAPAGDEVVVATEEDRLLDIRLDVALPDEPLHHAAAALRLAPDARDAAQGARAAAARRRRRRAHFRVLVVRIRLVRLVVV